MICMLGNLGSLASTCTVTAYRFTVVSDISSVHDRCGGWVTKSSYSLVFNEAGESAMNPLLTAC